MENDPGEEARRGRSAASQSLSTLLAIGNDRYTESANVRIPHAHAPVVDQEAVESLALLCQNEPNRTADKIASG